ncbi:hypothetical protein [Jatrophihabitans fulvus]
MTDPTPDVPVDPMDDDSLRPDPPSEPDAVEAAERMNDPDGAHPGVSDQTATSAGDDAVPELPQ